MLMADSQIRAATESGELKIEPFADECLEAASYDMRIGKRLLMSGQNEEIDLSKRGSATLKPGVFALVTTHESVGLSERIAGHIGVKSYYTRKGIVMLSGLQIDPGFEGVLVIGLYNASPRSITLEYQAPFCTVEFLRLTEAAAKPFAPGAEQISGKIPSVDKDYLRTLETQSLSEMAEQLRQLSINVGDLATTVGAMKWVLGIGLASLALLISLFGLLQNLRIVTSG